MQLYNPFIHVRLTTQRILYKRSQQQTIVPTCPLPVEQQRKERSVLKTPRAHNTTQCKSTPSIVKYTIAALYISSTHLRIVSISHA